MPRYKNTPRHEFSYDQFIELAERDLPAWIKLRSSRERGEEWTGGASFNDAVGLAKFGWREGLERMERAVESVAIKTDAKQTEAVYDVTGCDCDIDRFLSGEPECMLDFIETQTDKIVRVIVNATVACEIKQSVIFTRGAAIVSMVEALELSGIRCEIVATWCVELIDIFVTIKRSNEPIDLDRLAFVFGHVAFCRRLIFSAQEQLLGNDNRPGYGHCLEYQGEPGDVYIPSATYGRPWRSADETHHWMREKLKTLGVTFQAA